MTSPDLVQLRSSRGNPGRALPSLNVDGTRHRLHPRPSRGGFWHRRRVVAYALIALFMATPLIDIGGRPALLIDLGRREIAIAGALFRPSDGALLMLFGLAIVMSIFLVTALAGRVWCGWACPQTVWLEWVFRPLERWLEGSPQQQRQLDAHPWRWRRVVKNLVFLGLSFALAHTFLAYFVTSARVLTWVQGSPAAHPGGFAVVMVTTAMVFFDFAFFREQTCTIACPYGRLQSVLLDGQSLIVGYDAARGEPRGKGGAAAKRGDCVDCSACVATCPTGIDIRDGLQMECIGCAQCIDACDAVMGKLHRPLGLIRYSSQDQLAGGKRHLLRVRTVVYPLLVAAAIVGLVTMLETRPDADVWIIRGEGAPFSILPSGEVSTPVRIRIENRADHVATYQLEVVDAMGAGVIAPQPRWTLGPGKAVVAPLFVISPQPSFVDGRRAIEIKVASDSGFARTLPVTLLGPEGGQQ